jgi:Tfp pilus assembly protein PilO
MKRFSFLKTYRQHNYALIAVFFVLMLLTYSVNIRNTIKTYQQYNADQKRLKMAQNAAQDIALYRSELTGMQQTAQQSYNREYLLEQITTFCREHNLLIKSFPISQKVVENNYPVVTNEIEVEGGYLDIVSLAYMIEQQKKLSSISSLTFNLVKDRIKQQQFLHGRFTLRNIETTPQQALN